MNAHQIVAQKNAEYTEYIHKHIKNVEEAWKRLQTIFPNEIFVTDSKINKAISERIKQHDSSKFSDEEFGPYRRFFYPIYREEKKAAYNDFQTAWRLHYKRNDHHWEHWIAPAQQSGINENNINIQDFQNTIILERGDKRIESLIEMICDWIAMGMNFGNTAKEYYDKNKEKIRLIPSDREFVESILNRMN